MNRQLQEKTIMDYWAKAGRDFDYHVKQMIIEEAPP